jgi:hypothetical protein
MLEFCLLREHQVAVVVVYNVSRFSRNQTDHLTVRTALAGVGITLRSVTELIDDTAVGKFTEGILSAVAQFDNDQKSERTKAGMVAALKRGRWTHQAPLGYRSGERDGPSLIPDDGRAELVRRAFGLVAEGVASSETRRRIAALGLRTLKGKELTSQSFHNLLRNPLYCGRIKVVAWGISTQGDFESLVTPEQLNRMTDEQLDRAKAAYTVIVALEQEVAADEAQRASFGARPTEHVP